MKLFNTRAATQTIGRAAFLAYVVLLLGACAQDAAAAKDDQTTAGSVIGYNHTAEYIHRFYVGDRGGSGNAQPYGNGGASCCVSYPRSWRPDLSVSIRWTTSSADPEAEGDAALSKWHTAVVPIERYETPGRFNVHFLPGNKVKVVISDMTPRHPKYPGPAYPEAPPDFKFKF